MDAEGALTERHVHDPHDGVGNFSDIRIGRDSRSKPFENVVAEIGVRAGFVFGSTGPPEAGQS